MCCVNEVPVGFNVVDKQYPTQSLKVAPGKVDLSPEDEKRTSEESARIKAALATYSLRRALLAAAVAAGAGCSVQLLRITPHIQQ